MKIQETLSRSWFLSRYSLECNKVHPKKYQPPSFVHGRKSSMKHISASPTPCMERLEPAPAQKLPKPTQ